MASSDNRLESVERQLDAIVENFRQINVIVSDFQPRGQEVFNQKIQSLIEGLQELSNSKHDLQNVYVPLEVFNYIDNGENPQLYTKHCIDNALAKNEEVKGKVDAYRKFKATLLEELCAVFPNETSKYRAMRLSMEENITAPKTS